MSLDMFKSVIDQLEGNVEESLWRPEVSPRSIRSAKNALIHVR